MQTYAITTHALSKTYRKTRAVDDVTLNIPRGEIFGLVGENGAGKSTLMKMLAGLIHPTSGSFSLLGNVPEADDFLYHRIGALIEEPGLLPTLSAFENMKAKALAMGVAKDRELQGILDLCDIGNTGNKRVSAFSLGMKQRLAIAMTLIGDPDLLILDEPSNGIDPRGFEAIRSLLIRLNREQGKTIFISSHQLEELSKLATSYGFMKNGRIVEQLSRAELEDKSKDYLLLRTADSRQAAVCLEELLHIHDYRILNRSDIQITEETDSAALIALLVKHDVPILECSWHHQSLEQYFFHKNEMWNLFKSDVYRLLHSRFFFVLTLLYTLMTILLVSTEGVIVSNTSFASFDGRTSTLADFLAFLPKNAIFLFFVVLAYILFLSEEYQSRYVKSIYPFFQRKEKLIFARIMTFAAIWSLYILIGVLWSSFWLGALIGRTGTLILPDYLLFLLAMVVAIVIPFRDDRADPLAAHPHHRRKGPAHPVHDVLQFRRHLPPAERSRHILRDRLQQISSLLSVRRAAAHCRKRPVSAAVRDHRSFDDPGILRRSACPEKKRLVK